MSFLLLHPDHHCGVGTSQPVRIYLPGALGWAAGSAVLSYLLGGAGDRMGQHHGLAYGCAGTLRLWPGHGQPASGQTQWTEGEEAERTWWEDKMGKDEEIRVALIWLEGWHSLFFVFCFSLCAWLTLTSTIQYTCLTCFKGAMLKSDLCKVKTIILPATLCCLKSNKKGWPINFHSCFFSSKIN